MDKRNRYFRVTWYVRIPANFWFFFFFWISFFLDYYHFDEENALKFGGLYNMRIIVIKALSKIAHNQSINNYVHYYYHYFIVLYLSLSLDHIINNNMIYKCILCLLPCLPCPFISFVTFGSWLRFGLNFSFCCVTFFFLQEKIWRHKGETTKEKEIP